MKYKDIDLMARYLPKTVRIAKTPDFIASVTHCNDSQAVRVEFVELKTKDVIASFLGMQKIAIKNASKIRDEEAKRHAISRIRAMTYFSPTASK